MAECGWGWEVQKLGFLASDAADKGIATASTRPQRGIVRLSNQYGHQILSSRVLACSCHRWLSPFSSINAKQHILSQNQPEPQSLSRMLVYQMSTGNVYPDCFLFNFAPVTQSLLSARVLSLNLLLEPLSSSCALLHRFPIHGLSPLNIASFTMPAHSNACSAVIISTLFAMPTTSILCRYRPIHRATAVSSER